jgi:hypothetical protein
MPARQMLAALFAVDAVDGELADDGPAWDLGLKLPVETVLDDIAATVGTLLG